MHREFQSHQEDQHSKRHWRVFWSSTAIIAALATALHAGPRNEQPKELCQGDGGVCFVTLKPGEEIHAGIVTLRQGSILRVEEVIHGLTGDMYVVRPTSFATDQQPLRLPEDVLQATY